MAVIMDTDALIIADVISESKFIRKERNINCGKYITNTENDYYNAKVFSRLDYIVKETEAFSPCTIV